MRSFFVDFLSRVVYKISEYYFGILSNTFSQDMKQDIKLYKEKKRDISKTVLKNMFCIIIYWEYSDSLICLKLTDVECSSDVLSFSENFPFRLVGTILSIQRFS